MVTDTSRALVEFFEGNRAYEKRREAIKVAEAKGHIFDQNGERVRRNAKDVLRDANGDMVLFDSGPLRGRARRLGRLI